VNQRNPSSDIADAPADNAKLGEDKATAAPSPNGHDTGSTEHNPPATAEVSNGQAAEPPEPRLAPSDDGRVLLEERIRRLEEALTQLHEMKERQAREPAPPTALVAPVAQIVAPPTAPITTTPNDAASSFLFHVGNQMLSSAPLPTMTHPVQESRFGAGMRWTWLFFDAYAEVRVLLRMFVDPRYQMSWTSRLVPIVLGLLLLTSGYWAPGTSLPGVGTLIDKLIDLPLAFLFFKVLSHEARRYRQTSPDLSHVLRLPPDR
jgi:hypothetical protein